VDKELNFSPFFPYSEKVGGGVPGRGKKKKKKKKEKGKKKKEECTVI